MPDPHTLIGGSTPSLGSSVPSSPDGFDAYCATVFAHPDQVFDDLFVLLDSAGHEPTQFDGGKIPYYAVNRVILDAKGHRLLSVKSGGSNPHPHVECKGVASPLVCTYLREHYRHRPTRIDHAIDLSAEGLFDRLEDYAKDLARQYRLKCEPDGDDVNPDAGRTRYLGSRNSQVFVRIYQKGLKYAQEMGVPITDELRNWVRIELEFKPQTKTAKALASSILPQQAWGSTIWTSQLAKEVLSMPTEPVCIRERRESNRERALRFMGAQYASHLRALFDDCGGDMAEFGRAIADLANIEPDECQDAA